MYIPPVDQILSLSLIGLERVKRVWDMATYDALMKVILDDWKHTSNFWGDFVQQVVAECTLP